jgi:uncharacterized 2Fe-2S/4Fe-4S cluster protein (DUF4445 family)
MRASPGAIDRVSWSAEAGDLTIRTLGDAAPRGICGSGLFDLLAALLDAGVVDPTGRLLPPDELPPELPQSLRDRVVETEETTVFRLGNLEVTAGDIRQLQLAKGAVNAGITALLQEAGVGVDEVEAIYTAGAFGNFVRPESARRVGLVPPAVTRLAPLGNAAARGARLALLSTAARERAKELAATTVYVELAGNPRWRNTFAEAMLFPE